ncbi:MAG: acyl--CoA ligase [Alphaproteobacteria bacterium]|nr:acyl--CoA ligase [Alphaproteobacteria bacterium]
MNPSQDEYLAGLPHWLHDLPSRHARAAPDSVAIVEGARAYTYRELSALIATAESKLAAHGVRPGDRVLMLVENTIGAAAILFALSRLGAWAMIVNARLTPREIDQIHSHSDPRRVIYFTGVSDEAKAHATRHGATAETWPGLGPVAIGSLRDTATEPVASDPAARAAVVLYTSGTTGTPKGVILSHRSLIFVASGGGMKARVGPDDRIYCVLPMSHIFGLASTFLRCIFAGATGILAPRFSAADLAGRLGAGEITVLNGVPAMYARLLDYAASHGLSLQSSALQLLTVGGLPVDPDLKVRIEAAFDQTAVIGYGLTETAATVSRSLPPVAGPNLNAGRPLDALEVGVMDATGQAVAAGEVGELWVRGPNVMLGYFRDPAATEEVLSGDGWLRTGDLARCDSEGNLHIVDRSKDIIIRSGFNVSPVEIETVLNAHPDVLLSAVVSAPAGDGEEDIFAFVQLASGAESDEAALLTHATAELAAYKRPSRIVIVDALPASSTGKVIKADLKQRASDLIG